MAEGHREAAPRVLDGREHHGTLAAEGRRLSFRYIAVYPRILAAANIGQYPIEPLIAKLHIWLQRSVFSHGPVPNYFNPGSRRL